MQWGPNALSFVTTAPNKRWAYDRLADSNVEAVARISCLTQALLHRNFCPRVARSVQKTAACETGTLCKHSLWRYSEESQALHVWWEWDNWFVPKAPDIRGFLYRRDAQVTVTDLCDPYSRKLKEIHALSYRLCTYLLCKTYLRSGTAGR